MNNMDTLRIGWPIDIWSHSADLRQCLDFTVHAFIPCFLDNFFLSVGGCEKT